MTPTTCPDARNWQALLEARGTRDEPDHLVQHLEICADCQHTLETLAADPAIWEDAAQGLGPEWRAAAQEPTLRHLVQQLKSEDTLPPEEEDLSFLRSADKPGLLGLLGQYEVLEVIGRGGMGVVFKALDPDLNRVVAVKVLSPRLASSATARRRFIREGKAAAAVSHDHIVTIHGVSEAEGLPYLVMQLVAGESLQDRLDRTGPLELTELLRIGLQTASGLAAAHAQGLIHRDIKPANLLLENGVARVKITDFGLARTADDVQVTQNGVVAGTPEYMAPEQARGDPIDHRVDLFSLGSVLYAMCTGLPPFRGSTTLGVLRQVIEQEPAPIRSVNPDLPAWLETLVIRLLAKDRYDRFESAAEVAALLEGYLAHLRQPATVPAPALPASPAAGNFGLARRWWRPGVVKWFSQPLLVPAFLLLAAVGLGISLWFAAAGPGTDGGTPAKKEKFQEYYHSFKGDQEIGPGYRFDGVEPESCVQFEPDGLHITLPAGVAGQRIGTGLATTFEIKGDFEITINYEVLQEPEPADAGQGTLLYLWVDLTTPALKRAMLIRGVSPGKQFGIWMDLADEDPRKPPTRDGRSFPAAAKTGRLRLVRAGLTLSYHVADGSGDNFTLLHQHSFSADDVKEVRIGGQTGGPKAALDFRVTDLRIRAESIPSMPKETAKDSGEKLGLVIGLASLLAITLALGVWLFLRQRRRAGKIPPTGSENGNQARADSASPYVSFPCSDCGKNLKAKANLAGKKVKCPQCGTAVVVPGTSQKAPPPAKGLNKLSIIKKWWVFGAIFLFLLVAGLGWAIWPEPAKKPSSFVDVTLGNEFLSGIEESGFSYQQYDKDKAPYRWTDGHCRMVIPIDKEKPPQGLAMELHVFRPEPGKTVWLQIKVNNRELFKQRIPQWKWEKTFDLRGIDLGEELVLDILSDTFIPKGIMDGGSNDDARTLGVQVWCVKLLSAMEAGPAPINIIETPLHIWNGHPEAVSHGVITPDGRTLVSGRGDGTIEVWDVAANKERKTFPGLVPTLQAVAVSPKAETFATATDDRMVRIWDADSGQLKATLRGHAGQITSLAYSPDGRTLASAGGDHLQLGALKLWDVATGKERFPIEPFKLRLWGLAYAPDGKSVAVTGGDRTVQIVDTNSGKVRASIPLPQYGRSVAFSRDGTLLAVNFGDKGRVQIHEVDGSKEISSFQAPGGQFVFGLAFAPDGKRLLTPCEDGTSIIWDVSQSPAKALTLLKGHEGKVFFGVFFPDGRTVATGGADRTIRLWNVGGPE